MGAAGPAGDDPVGGVGDLVRAVGGQVAEQVVLAAVGVVEDGADVALRAVGEDGDDPVLGGQGAGQPAGDERDGADAPATGGVVVAGQAPGGPDRFRGGDPVHFVEEVVGDVAGVDAAAQAAHQARGGGLAEDGRSGGVHADDLQVGEEAAQDGGDAGGVAAGTDGDDEGVDPAELGDEFVGERGVGGHVVGVVVLVGAPGIRVAGEEVFDAEAPCLLPAPGGVRDVDEVDLGAVRGEQPRHQRFHARVGDDGDRVAVDGPGEREAEAEGAGSGLDDPRAGQQVSPCAGGTDHVQGGAVLDAARVVAFELGPEAASGGGERLTDPQDGGVADESGGGVQGAFGVGQQLGG